MYGLTDLYRDLDYHGGTLHHIFRTRWIAKLANLRFKNRMKENSAKKNISAEFRRALNDPEVAAIPALVDALREPDKGVTHGSSSRCCFRSIRNFGRNGTQPPRRPKNSRLSRQLLGVYGIHLAGDMRSWEDWQGPKKFTVGPPIYLDRPVYQYHYESLRWFDLWLKGNDTGIMDDPPVHVFLDSSEGEWVEANEWPLPQTRWTPFYLHEHGLLSEHEFWPTIRPTVYIDSPYERGSAFFHTPAMVEATDVCGPMALTLYALDDRHEVLWFVQSLEIDANGLERLLTRGWLRGSQRRIDPSRSSPGRRIIPMSGASRSHREIDQFDIEIRPYGIWLRPGYRLAIRISGHDGDAPTHHLHGIASGHGRANRARACRSTTTPIIHRNLLLPVTRGNRIGTFISGGMITSDDDRRSWSFHGFAVARDR